jgi:hypothetical protein
MTKDVVVQNGLLRIATGTFVCMVGDSERGRSGSSREVPATSIGRVPPKPLIYRISLSLRRLGTRNALSSADAPGAVPADQSIQKVPIYSFVPVGPLDFKSVSTKSRYRPLRIENGVSKRWNGRATSNSTGISLEPVAQSLECRRLLKIGTLTRGSGRLWM